MDYYKDAITRIEYIRHQTDYLVQVRDLNELGPFAGDLLKWSGIKYSLLTLLQGLIDVTYIIVSQWHRYVPSDDGDAIIQLFRRGTVDEETKDIVVFAIMQRNRLISGPDLKR